MWRELQIPNVFTMEASFCGADKGEIADQHFQTDHLQMAGQKLLEALIIYFKVTKGNADKKADSKDEGLKSSTAIKVSDIETELKENQKLIQMTAGCEDEEEDEGSDSEPSGDNLDELELAELVPIVKEKVQPQPTKEVKNVKPKKPDTIKTKPQTVNEESKSNSAQQKLRQAPPKI